MKAGYTVSATLCIQLVEGTGYGLDAGIIGFREVGDATARQNWFLVGFEGLDW